MPPRSWVRPRSARWKACECALAKPGQRRGRAAGRRRAPGRPTLDGGDPAVVHGDRAPRPTEAVGEPGVLAPVGRSRQRLDRPGEGGDAGEAVRLARRARRGSGRPRSGCGRTASPSGSRRPRGSRRRGRRRWAARGAPSSAASRSRRAASKPVTGGPRLLDGRGCRPRARRRRRRARTASSAGPRASSQAVTADGIAFTPFGSTRTLPTVASAPCRSAAARAARTAAAQREHRVVAVGQPGGARRGRPGRAGPAASGRAARSTTATPTGAPSSTSARPCSTCSSTKVPIRRRVSSSRPSAAGSRPARGHRLGHRRAVVVGQRAGPVGVERAGEQPGAGAGDAEPGALLVGEAGDAHRPARRRPGRAARRARRTPTRPRAGRRTRRRRARSRGGCRRRGPGLRRRGPPSRPTGSRPGRSRRPARAAAPRRGTTRAARRPRGSRRTGGSRRCRRPGRPARGRPTSGRSPRVLEGHVLALRHRHADAALLGDLAAQVVAGVDVPDHAGGRVVAQHPLQLLRGQRRCRRRR